MVGILAFFQYLTQAYKLGMTDQGHVWFIPHWYTDYFWTIPDPEISCSVKEMTTFMYTSTFILLSEMILSQEEEPTVSGLVCKTVYLRLCRFNGISCKMCLNEPNQLVSKKIKIAYRQSNKIMA